MFTRKEVNFKQVKPLHAAGILPVSVDYRFVPEPNIVRGPMNEVCEALGWARFALPDLAPGSRRRQSRRTPDAVLALYCPTTDYEDDSWKSPIYPEASVSSPNEPYDLLEAVEKEPVCIPPPSLLFTPYCKFSHPGYPSTNTNHPGMLMSLADPRWRFVLHMNWKANTIAFLFGGVSGHHHHSDDNDSDSDKRAPPPPSASAIASISPLAQIRRGTYRTPTFLIHGRPDDMIPWQQSHRTVDALRAKGVEAHLEVVKGARHLFHTFPERGIEFEAQVRMGYEWLVRMMGGGK
ncbi:MAG: hypothetical protein Q9169_002491 [Polycauliona sp. 2 TL-2023]